MINKVLPSVVNIRTEAVGTSPLQGGGRLKAEGSGVVIDNDGTILTNNHVVAGAYKVSVLSSDSKHRALPGTVVGTDPGHDVAVVHVDAHDLTPIRLANSSELSLGDTVVALGFPLDLGGPTVTKGIVSGLDRTIDVQGGATGAEHLVGVMQTDAAINPGNSGGPLVDRAGRLVGINTAAASAAAAENVGFAIPIDEVLPVVRGLLAHPTEKQPWLGVQTVTLSSFGAFQLGLPSESRGAAVVGVIPQSPAAHAGLRPGDVITAVDSASISSSPDLTAAIAHHRPGDSITVHLVSRSGDEDVEVQLASRPATFPVPKR
jgi:S1-C subfamily serine protease